MCKACDYTIHGAQHHFGWDNALVPAERVEPGATILFHCHDSSAGQLGPSSTLAAAAWIGTAITLGILGAWNQRLTAAEQESPDDDPAAREAIELIQRLQDLSGQMSTGLDAPASATLALDLLSAEVPSTRSAVPAGSDTVGVRPRAWPMSVMMPLGIAAISPFTITS